MNIIKGIINFIKWFIKEQDKLCPHCGYYCTCKTVFCTPPIEKQGEETEV